MALFANASLRCRWRTTVVFATAIFFRFKKNDGVLRVASAPSPKRMESTSKKIAVLLLAHGRRRDEDSGVLMDRPGVRCGEDGGVLLARLGVRCDKTAARLSWSTKTRTI